jgi:hypothetical protein
MSGDAQPYLSPEFQARALEEFLARHITPHDPQTDEYHRPPFAEDIKEGKNSSIYNAHSYHTKVPPRSIIPYILHYTQPGDVILDPFCGSGMTGVAAQMCSDPPTDLLEQFPDLKERVGSRACILNDLSPAACHIAYNYNTPVDVDALEREFERIKAAVKDEVAWLYGTEHYEPAIGAYSAKKPEVIARLKNPPPGSSSDTLIENTEPTWELLTRVEVESRLGYTVTDLPRDDAWGEFDLTNVDQWISIPATIQYTIWSDVYRCEGFVTVEEPTGKLSTRGKNAGKPMVRKRRVARGCGQDIVLWIAAVDKAYSIRRARMSLLLKRSLQRSPIRAPPQERFSYRLVRLTTLLSARRPSCWTPGPVRRSQSRRKPTVLLPMTFISLQPREARRLEKTI